MNDLDTRCPSGQSYLHRLINGKCLKCRTPETKKLQVQHLPSDYPMNMIGQNLDLSNYGIIFQQEVADQEQRWGEERVSANEN
jgi:hypothetical protein